MDDWVAFLLSYDELDEAFPEGHSGMEMFDFDIFERHTTFITKLIQMDSDDLINVQLTGNLLQLPSLPTGLLFHRAHISFSLQRGWLLPCTHRTRLRNHCLGQ